MTRTCSDCPAPISTQSRLGRCRLCAIKVMNRDPDFRAARAAGIRKRHEDPTFSARVQRQVHAANLRAWRDPERSGRLHAALTENRKQLDRPDVRAKWLAGRAEAGRKHHETVMAWCPVEYRAEYRYLRLTKKMLAADAKAAILAKLTPFERQMQKVRAGAGIVEVRPLRAAESAHSLTGCSSAMVAYG